MLLAWILTAKLLPATALLKVVSCGVLAEVLPSFRRHVVSASPCKVGVHPRPEATGGILTTEAGGSLAAVEVAGVLVESPRGLAIKVPAVLIVEVSGRVLVVKAARGLVEFLLLLLLWWRWLSLLASNPIVYVLEVGRGHERFGRACSSWRGCVGGADVHQGRQGRGGRTLSRWSITEA